MSTILVTGASGFIGGHLTEALARRGHQVRCLVRRTSQIDHLPAPHVDLVYGDLTDAAVLRQAVVGTDAVFHVAGLKSALTSRELWRVNARGVQQVAHACAACETPPVHVLVSSVAAAGPTPRWRLRQESDRPAPISNYGRSKRVGELFAEQWARDVPTTIVRPGVVFGPRDQTTAPLFQCIQKIRLHCVPTFDPPPLSLIHIEDLVEILIRASESGERLVADPTASDHCGQGYYFACADEYPDYRQLGRLIATALGIRHLVTLSFGNPLPWFIGAATQMVYALRGRASSVNVDKIREATADSWACSTASVRRSLEFQMPRTLSERLRSTSEWYRQNGWL